MSGIRAWRKKPFWIRLTHWEYWNFDLIYGPLYPIYMLMGIRAGSFFFFSASNPKIKNGGFLGESKKDIYAIVPAGLQPRTIFFDRQTDPGMVCHQLTLAGFTFPLIGKPDIGGRGRGVKKLEDAEALRAYAEASTLDYHIQEFVPYEKEAGIFYYRYPGEEKGHISGIVHKEFLKVQGDGIRTVRELMDGDPRAILQIPRLEMAEPGLLAFVPPAGESFTVVPYGNHARGAMFIDDSASVNAKLESVIHEICLQIPEFYFGRLDIRYASRELLEQGSSFSVLEVNGAGSDPTHIYDPRHSIFFAWKEILRHWIILLKISRANHRRGYRYLTVAEGLRMFRQNNMDSKKLEAL